MPFDEEAENKLVEVLRNIVEWENDAKYNDDRHGVSGSPRRVSWR